MPLYMTQFSYTKEAWALLTKRPEDRGAVFKKLVEALGGRLLNIYYCMGDYDGVVIYEVPDNVIAIATVMTAITPGHLKAIKTTVLFTMDEAVEAMAKAGRLAYRGPKAFD